MLRILLLVGVMSSTSAAYADIAPRAAPAAPPVHYQDDTLAKVATSHALRCGLITAAEDYSMSSTHGDLSQLGADLCRALAAAFSGGTQPVLSGYPDDMHGLQALHDNSIDLLFGVTPDAASALPYSIAFGPTVLFDGQGFLVNRASGVKRPEQLGHKLLCFITGTSQEARMNAWQGASGVKFYAHDFQERGEMDAALVAGKCDAITDDVTALAQMRSGFHGRIKDFVILPELIAIDAWTPALRAGDTRLAAALTDVMAALIRGEELGITAANVAQPHPGAEALFGPTPGIAATLAMPDGWARRAIGARGNYAEIFERNLGGGSVYGLSRGHDALWSAGGMLAAPTLR